MTEQLLIREDTEPQAAALVGRSSEQAALERLVYSVRNDMSAALVLRGEPGVGKSALLDYICDAATGVEVRRLSGLESEAHLGFAAIHRLLVPYLGLIDQIPATQARAIRIAMGLADGPAPNSFMLGLSILSVFDVATRDRPLFCAIDDAQCLDDESIEILGFVARRLHAERVGLVFSVREPAGRPLLEGIPSLILSGLMNADAADLLISLAPGRVDRKVADHVADRSRGNPLVIVEVSKELNYAHPAATSLLLDDPLPLSERLESHFRRQITDLPGDTQTILLFAAAHPDPDPRLLWRAVRAQGIDADDAQPAVDAGLVSIHPTFQFRHPLIRSAVYAHASSSQLRHAHTVLADLVSDRSELDLRAWHLAAAAVSPDERVAAMLERGARSARARGGFLSEAAHLARAAELSPEPSQRATRLLDAAHAALTGGAPLRAQSLLEAGLRDINDPYLLARLQRLQANALHRSGRPGHGTPATLLEAARVFAPLNADLARETMLEALEQTFIRGALITGTTPVDVGRAALEHVTGDGSLADILLEAAGTCLSLGYVRAAPLIARALTAFGEESALSEQVPRWFSLGLFLAQLSWDEQAGYAWLTRCEELARTTGSIDCLISALVAMSGLETTMGQLLRAEARMAEVRRLSAAVGINEGQIDHIDDPRLLAWLGRDDDARGCAAYTFATGTAIGAGNQQRLARQALIIVELGHGRYEQSYELASRLRSTDELGAVNDALPDLVEAAVRSGRRCEADLALQELRVRAEASGSDWARGLLARCQALLAPDDSAATWFEEALKHFSVIRLVTETARTHLLYGEWLRRQKKRSAAREQLRLAHDIFDDIGAASFATRARIELEATGEHSTTSRDGLTPQEAQIAQLAAEGSTNQEIASQLFISGHTVEYHLRKVFRKLGITSRRRLGDALRH